MILLLYNYYNNKAFLEGWVYVMRYISVLDMGILCIIGERYLIQGAL